MAAIDFQQYNDQQLAAIIRTQVGRDALSIQGVPPMQQMMAEAICRILARPVVVVQQAEQLGNGQMRKGDGPQMVKG
jgi:hypothetical protein